MPSWLIWVIVAIIVIAVIAAVVAASTKRKQQQNRSRAGELREQAAAQATGLQQREAHARETEARAAEARAEADRKRAEAERLEAEARDRHETAAGYREQHAENLRRADELDPDVDTRRDGYEPPAPAGTETAGTETAGTETAGTETAGTETAGTTGSHRVHDRLDGETTAEAAPGHSHEVTHEHTDDGTTVTHPDGSTETVTRSPASTHDQAKGDPSDPRLEGGTHRA
jgi:hypothetical protein